MPLWVRVAFVALLPAAAVVAVVSWVFVETERVVRASQWGAKP